MIKVAHEAPLQIMSLVQTLTDYDYALVHMFEENEDYYKFFKDALAKGREVILDNSIFELNTAFKMHEFAEYVTELKPTWYIIPDALEDKDTTIKQCIEWVNDYQPQIPRVCKSIAVVQGSTYDEVVECYKAIEPLVDKVAISFDYCFFKDLVSADVNMPTKFHGYMYGRKVLLNKLVDDNVINQDKPHHLLGAGLPQEFKGYAAQYPWIDSIDTSNPVVHGLFNIKYDEYGLNDKVSTKLYTLINSEVSQEQIDDIEYNVNIFKTFLN